MALSLLTVWVLFLISNNLNPRDKSFSRHFDTRSLFIEGSLDIKQKTYYLAGVTSNHIYLGDTKKPLTLSIVNKSLTDTAKQNLTIKDFILKRSTHTRVTIDSPNFYITNGVIPAILKGDMINWEATTYMPSGAFFIESVPLSGKSLAVKSVTLAKENVLGKIMVDSPNFKFAPGVLKKQIDGLFCTDGMLHFNKESNTLTYVYYYRNQFICMDSNLNVLYKGKTIDTTSVAKIKISSVSSESAIHLASPPSYVNKLSNVSGDLLFINSALLSKDENRSFFDEASVIDVYSLKEGTYKSSFYIFDFKGNKVRSFKVYKDMLVALQGNYVVTYRMMEYARK